MGTVTVLTDLFFSCPGMNNFELSGDWYSENDRIETLSSPGWGVLGLRLPASNKVFFRIRAAFSFRTSARSSFSIAWWPSRNSLKWDQWTINGCLLNNTRLSMRYKSDQQFRLFIHKILVKRMIKLPLLVFFPLLFSRNRTKPKSCWETGSSK